ncbi:glycosyltransferase family 4 protein [Terrabacter sp. NPDC000476]|uniref:glycosyltransferase family 4 protein n=1 Tax=Terrabacter sp. NPDC000476 TaxID=3154258 RepID=UPI00332091E4
MRPLSDVREIHAVVPAGIDDPDRPSGGNTYDRRVLDGLAVLGWRVVEHRVAGAWPAPDEGALRGLAAVVAAVPDAGLVLVDGLVASAAEHVLVGEASRVTLVPLVHLPLGVTDAGASAAEGRVLTASAAVVVTSSWTGEWLRATHRLPVGTVHVCPPGVDAAPAASGSAAGTRLLCVGPVTRLKGHLDLVEALVRVRDLPWTCSLLGSTAVEPSTVARVEEILARTGLVERVRLLGPRAYVDVGRAYASADLVVQPSHVETYGMVVGEALARGVPALVAAVGGVAEALGSTDAGVPGMLVPRGRPEELAASLRSWLTDAGLREELRRRAARRRATTTSWARTVAAVDAALLTAVESAPRTRQSSAGVADDDGPGAEPGGRDRRRH